MVGKSFFLNETSFQWGFGVQERKQEVTIAPLVKIGEASIKYIQCP